jgi:hypothetical protein
MQRALAWRTSHSGRTSRKAGWREAKRAKVISWATMKNRPVIAKYITVTMS